MKGYKLALTVCFIMAGLFNLALGLRAILSSLEISPFNLGAGLGLTLGGLGLLLALLREPDGDNHPANAG